MRDTNWVTPPGNGNAAAGWAQLPAGALAVRASMPLENPTQPSILPPGTMVGPKHAAVPSAFGGGTAAGSPASGTLVTPLLMDEKAAASPAALLQPSSRSA